MILSIILALYYYVILSIRHSGDRRRTLLIFVIRFIYITRVAEKEKEREIESVGGGTYVVEKGRERRGIAIRTMRGVLLSPGSLLIPMCDFVFESSICSFL